MQSRQKSHGLSISFGSVGLAVAGLALILGGLHATLAAIGGKADEEEARQVTVFGVMATPGSKSADSALTSVHSQLDKLLPSHGFKLLDAQSKSIVAGESVTSQLGNGYTVVTTLTKTMDDNGKVELRCELFQDERQQFSTLVKTPPSQLFFCQRAIKNGVKLLIGVGVR